MLFNYLLIFLYSGDTVTSSTLEGGRENRAVIRSMNLIEKAFRDVSREEWKAKIGEPEKVYLLEDHVSNMKGILSDLNYETYCIDRLIENTKKMDMNSAERYTDMMEAIAYFYSRTINRDIATAIVTGLVARMKDVKGVERYYRGITFDLDKRITRYSKSISLYDSRIYALNVEMRSCSTGFLKFFKKKKAVAAWRKIKRLEARSGRAKARLDGARALASRIGKD